METAHAAGSVQPAVKKRVWSISSRAVPVFLLLINLIAFGPLLPNLGFYWDDWAKMLVARLWGLRAYFAYYAEDRPISAWTHILFTPLLGQSPLPWQIFALLLRWLSAWGMWWTLNGLWPRAKRMNLIATLLFVLYPVFVSQPVAVTFHQQWLQFALFFGSLGCMVTAIRGVYTRGRFTRAAWLLTALALAGMLLQLSVTEYFVPLELVRPLVLFFLLTNLAAESGQAIPHFWPRLRRTLVYWSPYLMVLAGYTAWRLFILRLPNGDPYRANTLYNFLSQPLATTLKLAGIVLQDAAHILINSWDGLLNINFSDPPFTLFSYAAGLLAAGLAVVFLLLLREPGDAGEKPLGRDPWALQAMILGVVALLLGPVPAWITGRQVVFDFHSDRYAMPALMGAGLVYAALVAWLVDRRVQRAVFAGFFIFMAVGLHLRVANDYRWIWTNEQRFFWQLSYRAPGLKAPTALWMLDEPFPNQGLFSTSAALNLLYPQPVGWGAPASADQPAGTHNLAYWIYTIRPRYNHAPDSYDITMASQFRTLRFAGQTPQNSLLVHLDLSHGNCVWVLSQRDVNNPYVPDLEKVFIPISNLSQIESQPNRPGYPPTDLIGPEPPHTWCYYFEKADLARQNADWNTLAGLYDAAQAAGYHPGKSGADSPYEWLPFVEGLGHTGRLTEAADLTRALYQRDSHYQAMLCSLWGDGFADASTRQTVRGALSCPAPSALTP